MPVFNPLPAIMIGGPPHSGKSVLAYSLTQNLRALHIDHYLLRACPDGEGDWSNEADQQTVRTLRNKGSFTPNFVTNVIQALNARMLPLLVDVGGRPQPEQEAILAACSHAILIAQNAEQLAAWRDLTTRLQIPVIAELCSSLTERDDVSATFPLLQARIYGLERGQQVHGPVLQQLTALARAVLITKPQSLREFHLAQAPAETTVDLERLAYTLQTTPPGRWQPDNLPAVLAYLPPQEPLAIYGRAPNWLYAALARNTLSASFFQFDARLGWLQPAALTVAPSAQPDPTSNPITWSIHASTTQTVLTIHLTDPYLDFNAAQQLCLPTLPTTQGLIISGRIPLWLLTSLVRSYTMLSWIAIYQPPLNGAVIIHSTQATLPVGTVLPLALPT